VKYFKLYHGISTWDSWCFTIGLGSQWHTTNTPPQPVKSIQYIEVYKHVGDKRYISELRDEKSLPKSAKIETDIPEKICKYFIKFVFKGLKS
jgi:hypothetical protein